MQFPQVCREDLRVVFSPQVESDIAITAAVLDVTPDTIAGQIISMIHTTLRIPQHISYDRWYLTTTTIRFEFDMHQCTHVTVIRVMPRTIYSRHRAQERTWLPNVGVRTANVIVS